MNRHVDSAGSENVAAGRAPAGATPDPLQLG